MKTGRGGRTEETSYPLENKLMYAGPRKSNLHPVEKLA